jgi:hypothetical protein
LELSISFCSTNCPWKSNFTARRWFAEYKSDSSGTPSVTKSIALEIMNLVTPRVGAFVQQTVFMKELLGRDKTKVTH